FLLLGRSMLVLGALPRYDDLLAGGLEMFVGRWALASTRWGELGHHMVAAATLSGCTLVVLIAELVRRRRKEVSARPARLLAALSLLVGLVALQDLLGAMTATGGGFG